jgi:hypothetical protein
MGDLSVINGDLEIRGVVDGDVSVVGGELYLRSGSMIGGDIAVVSGDIRKEKGVVIKGKISRVSMPVVDIPLKIILKSLSSFSKIEYVEEIEKQTELELKDTLVEKKEFMEEEFEEEVEENKIFNFLKDIFIIFMIFILTYLFLFVCNVIFPGTIKNMEKKLYLMPLQSFGFGVLVHVFYLPVIFIMVISIIGIPIAFLILLSTPFLIIYGLVPYFSIIGSKILERVGIRVKNIYLSIMVSLLIPFIFLTIGILLSKIDIDFFIYDILTFMFYASAYIYIYFSLVFATGILIVSKLGIEKLDR